MREGRRTLFLSIVLLYQFQPPYTANFSDFIFLANSSTYAENRQNRGLTRFPKGQRRECRRHCEKKGRGLGAAPVVIYAIRRSLLAPQGRVGSTYRPNHGYGRVRRCHRRGTLKLECPHRDLARVALDEEDG